MSRQSPLIRMTGAFLGAVYFTVIALGLVLTALASPGAESLAGETGRGMGVAAGAMLAAQFLTSGRFKVVSTGMGLDALIGFHRFAAAFLLAFATLHVIAFAAPSFARSAPEGGAHLAALLSSPRMQTGVLALVGLLAMIGASVFRSLAKYELWRLTHGVGALAVLTLAGHHILSVGSAAFSAPLYIYWSAILGVGVIAFFYIYIGRPLLAMRSPWRLVSVRRLTPRLMEVRLIRTGTAPFSFKAGQFVWINFSPGVLKPFDNPFSIASAPSELPEMRFLIKTAGDLTRALPQYPPGALVTIDGPHGDLVEEGRAASSILLVAGGVGLAPLLAILRDLDQRCEQRPIRLVYGAGEPANLVFMDEIMQMTDRLPMSAIFTVDAADPSWRGHVGRIDKALLAQAVDGLDISRTLILLCGPTAMMEAAELALMQLGAPASNIIYESFSYE